MESSKSVIIVAGGIGNRMQSEIPKQFLPLNGKPVLFYSIEAFYNYDPDIQIVVVLPELYLDLWESICNEKKFNIKHNLVKGGNTRFHSVKNGLKKISHNGFIAVHDGARPLIDQTKISNLFDEAKNFGNSIPAISVNESIRMGNEKENRIIDRSPIFIIQTPQIFKVAALQKAYQQDFQEVFTDDASVVEKSGIKIHLSKGDRKNIKLTYPIDFKLAENLLSTT